LLDSLLQEIKMAASCCSSVVKFFMFFINVVFAIVGLILIGVGAYTQLQAKDYADFLSDNYVKTPIFIIIVGCVIFMIAFFGCCGAATESKCMIYTYSVLISLLLIAQIGAAIAAYALRGDIKTEIEDKMTKGMKNYGDDGFESTTNLWNVVQDDLNCCGVNGVADWADNGKETPDSCCKDENESKGCAENPDNLNTKGCLTEFESKFVGNFSIIGGVALGFGAVQLIGVLFSCYLAKRVRSGEDFY